MATIVDEVQFDGEDLKAFSLLLSRMAGKRTCENRHVYLWQTPNQFNGVAPFLYISHNSHHPDDVLIMQSLPDYLAIDELAKYIYPILRSAPICAVSALPR